jgi:DNA transposition AAA+ family ATPase
MSNNKQAQSEEIRNTKNEQATASSAHSRINIPLNLNNWKDLPADQQEILCWFHQHILDEDMNWEDVCETVGYDKSVVFKVLKGTYGANYDKIIAQILSYKDLAVERKKLKKGTFATNRTSAAVSAALDYAAFAGGIVEIIGESGQGKTVAARDWRDRHNHGRTVMVEVPAIGGVKGLLREICKSMGANQNQNAIQMQDSILRGFNKNRFLIIDEAHRLIPSDRRTHPQNLELLRYIHDRTGCGMAFIVTKRFDDAMRKNDYMFEQVIGRIDIAVRLEADMGEQDFMPLILQYVAAPSLQLKKLCKTIVNGDGRMRRLDKLLIFATKIASTMGEKIAEKHIFEAVKCIRQMNGDVQL